MYPSQIIEKLKREESVYRYFYHEQRAKIILINSNNRIRRA